ncbi:glycohydrolase toxin TNT-related protein [Thermomonospora amylolytica]|uniref:glycohydrolase toxin TNT-related protein n=1 Tax=Thermomonospora amylolytica TaxID=1411117 RepID=UPI001300B36C|nr:glycohydrolase toxin TNT-related protein [Thermomonospora amylolytica]
MALTPEERDARLDRIATVLVHLLPGGWESAELTYHAFGRNHEVAGLTGEMLERWRGRYPVQQAGRLLPRSGALELLRELRRDMYEPEHGTWTALRMTVRSGADEPRWDAGFQHLDDVAWEVSPADCAAELALFPRPPEAVPEWMRHRCALHEAAASFDPRAFLAEPQSEGALVEALGREDPQLFQQARLRLQRFLPGGAERLRIGGAAPGCWSVVRAEPAWLAVRCDDGGACGAVVPFDSARDALAHAMGGIMAEQGVEVNTRILSLARLIAERVQPRKGVAAWTFGDDYRPLHGRRAQSARPPAEVAARNAYIALDAFDNAPYEYLVCRPGPPPETGGYVSVHEVFELAARNSLPKPPRPATRSAPRREPEILPEGTEVDAYGDRDQPFVYSIGTPFSRRGLRGTPDGYEYHVYRVRKPLSAYPGLFAPWPFHPSEDDSARPEDDWAGYYLADSIETFIRSGHLVEITGPGGTPIDPADEAPEQTKG